MSHPVTAMESPSFRSLVQRVRRGDQQAAAELLRHYEPHIRRVVRVRLTDPGLRRTFDSSDICQSVMADFFVRTALGQFELESPEQLIALLATMARNKLIHHVDKQHAARRDVRRLEKTGVEDLAVAGKDPTASQIVADRELLAAARARLTSEEQYLADQRALGRPWLELAKELNATADALRVKLARAVDRVSGELGLEEGADG
jgi:RNA polymerase sigma-70 factor (ECF subfamily)